MTERFRLLELYYLATPLFALADLTVGLEVRAAGLESPSLRAGYYGGAFLLGLLCRARPPVAPWVGMGESAVNLTILMAGVLTVVYSVPEQFLAGEAVTADAVVERVTALALSGSVVVYSFYRHQADARRGRSDSLLRRL